MPYLQVKDLEMFYEKMGLGEIVIFLHSGYSRGILAFASQMLDFQKKYTCFFPDFRGHGRTKCETLEWSTPKIADDILEFMDNMDISKAHLIGYSLGANVGLYVAVNNSDRVATLTTIGSSGFCDPTGVEEFEPEWLVKNGKQDTINQMIERHMEAHKGNWQEHMRQSARDWCLYPQLSEEQLSSIKCPTLFITGEHDQFVGEEKIRHLSSLVKGSKYLIVSNGSHRPHMLRENPLLVNDAILQFLDTNSM
ncbi:pimeloyl-ACP methyl ester carboxylesterase [Paenibacillus sp. V4I3]|uniref:alpha/beta fold hydrolase n=1 Tax=unclassified Paenibacillus TaxID=185978 RepID=UPI00278BA2CC|nr:MULTISPECIES: alpha/beta hydrolase [unclassified Paenibacillus]MDQ0878755.1 pimeloyl-ACP methyl ester carboxylesterase [Paenibacillus sp. V4I3]MDQ0885392.1 pimeloyl-ACP methyl ester carboxylesterase [Paenibacillus sp. V4I9]